MVQAKVQVAHVLCQMTCVIRTFSSGKGCHVVFLVSLKGKITRHAPEILEQSHANFKRVLYTNKQRKKPKPSSEICWLRRALVVGSFKRQWGGGEILLVNRVLGGT